jgi:aspartate kinase
MKILVQKFGGTSISSHERRKLVINKIVKAKEDGYFPIVVVSAMGRLGDPYATDTLLSLTNSSFKTQNAQAVDLLMSCGEIISTVVLCGELFNQGISSVPLSGGQAGIITDESFNNAKVLKVQTDNLINLIKSEIVPVVAGFQGQDENGFITTLGRGGSDVSASILGVALKAEKVEIYTDVDGIMTADPRIVSDAALIEKISYNEVFNLADQGAKVIHPKAIEIAMSANIPLVIKNTLNNCSGTIINSCGKLNFESIITGITHMPKRIQIIVDKRNNLQNENYSMLLNVIAENNISIDLINVFPNKNIFTIDADSIDKFDCVMKKLGLLYTYVKDCSKIAIIGNKMRGIPGVMARILKTLKSQNIEVLQTADSYTTIWCLVEEEHTNEAIKALHKEFKLGE